MSVILKAFLGPENVVRMRDQSLDPEKSMGCSFVLGEGREMLGIWKPWRGTEL